jgi:S-layer protein (TIGR01567 family)
VYRTDAQENAFKCQDWGSYYSIGFLGEKYLAGYMGGGSGLWESSAEKNLMVTGQISKVLIDDDEERPISSGSSFALKEGYELRINSIDQDGRKVLLTLAKDGAEVDKDKVVVLDNAERWSYFYKTNIGSADNIVTIAVHFKNAYYSNESKLVTIDGIWQISDTATSIEAGTKIEKMTVSNVDFREGEMSIEMDNRDNSITLGKNKRVQLMKDFFIRTADQDDVTMSNPLRFYVYKAATIEGLAPSPTGTSVPVSADEAASAMPTPAVPSAPGKSPGFNGMFAIIGIIAGAYLVLGKKK